MVVASDFDDEALACVVPPFTLQPLIENAIRHGLAPKVGRGQLRIRGSCVGDRLDIEASDDGVGQVAPPLPGALGLGLTAVLRRARAHFGEAFVDAEVSTAPDAGFRVRLRVPAQTLSGSGATS
jgi:LytS/YehU family sensor histidine kinase